ncbi:MAG: GIY-YIG nuclease family protein, partial [Candidatus Cloacimonadota bacterium]
MEEIPQSLKDKLSFLPTQPGIYIWKNSEGEIIYVGKALNLHNRIKSYLSGSIKDPKTQQLVAHIADLEYTTLIWCSALPSPSTLNSMM